jgi:hypothetical protein
MPASSSSQLKGGRNHISVLYLSPQTDLGTITGLDKAVSGSPWWTLDSNAKILSVTGAMAATGNVSAGGSVAATGNVTAGGSVAAVGSVTGANFVTSSWTPTLTAVANVSSTTTGPGGYIRAGGGCVAWGVYVVDPVLSVTDTVMAISLPVASNLAAQGDLVGVANAYSNPPNAATIQADTTNHRANMQMITQTASPITMFFIFGYRIL